MRALHDETRIDTPERGHTSLLTWAHLLTPSVTRIAAALRRAGRSRGIDQAAADIRTALRKLQLRQPLRVENAMGKHALALLAALDNALAETVNGYYKAELIYGPARRGPWKTVEDVELATLGWVHWHNTGRLHGYLDDLPARRVRGHLLGYETDRPTPGRNPIARVSIRSRAIQPLRLRPAGRSRLYASLSSYPNTLVSGLLARSDQDDDG
jgi:transposase InsO family protein